MSSRVFRVTLTLALWASFILGFEALSMSLGPAIGLAALLLVALTSWRWGALIGLMSGPAAWLALNLLDGSLDSGFLDVQLAVREGSLYEPLTFLLVGVAAGSMRNLRNQLRVHKSASDRAQYDVLTGLLNRAAFIAAVERTLEEAVKSQEQVAVLFVDLDRFKFVNDTYGHEVGDELLKEIAQHLRDNVRENDLVARLGGDEFILALRGFRDGEVPAAVAEKLVEVLNSPFEINGRVLHISVSIGISIFPKDGETVEVLMKSADSAMYQVKEDGKNAYVFSTVELRAHQSRQLQLERQLRLALQENELELLYQPQVDLNKGALVGFEALLRWENRELGKVSPKEFIPVAEEAGLIIPIGHWLLREACYQVKAWEREGFRPPKVAVNVSTLQFRQPDFLELVSRALKDSRLDPQYLEIEVTESVLFREFELAVQTLRRLERIGVRSALDDFGTGYSSLAYLQRLPVSHLKIDRSFISTLSFTTQGYVGAGVAIVEAICVLARKMDKKVLAEGVETEGQRRFLLGIGCDYAQGFLFSKALKPFEAERSPPCSTG